MKVRGVGAPTFNDRLTGLSFCYATTCLRPEMTRQMLYQRAVKKIHVVLRAKDVSRILDAGDFDSDPSRDIAALALIDPDQHPIARKCFAQQDHVT